MRRLSAAAFLAIGAACASAQTTPPSAPPPEPVASSSAKAPPLPTTLLPGVGMSTAPVGPDVDADEEDTAGPAPLCAKDEDCWSRSCCPAKAPEECVHASRARKCAIVDVSCKPTPIHYTCFCESGACKGRLAPP